MQKIESSVKSVKNIVMEYLQAAERRDFFNRPEAI